MTTVVAAVMAVMSSTVVAITPAAVAVMTAVAEAEVEWRAIAVAIIGTVPVVATVPAIVNRRRGLLCDGGRHARRYRRGLGLGCAG